MDGEGGGVYMKEEVLWGVMRVGMGGVKGGLG